MKCYFNQLKMHVNLWVTDDNGSCLNPHFFTYRPKTIQNRRTSKAIQTHKTRRQNMTNFEVPISTKFNTKW